MRKLIRHRFCSLLLAVFIIFIASCEVNMENTDEIKILNQEDSEGIVDQRINDAQIYFETEIKDSLLFSTQKGNHNNFWKSLKKHLIWEDAFIKQLSCGFGIVIPLSYEKEFYVSKGNSKIPLSQLSYVLMYLDECGDWVVELVTTIPDQTFSNSPDINPFFSGMILIEDCRGNFIRAFLYKDEMVSDFIIEETTSKVEADCVYTDWYSCPGSVTEVTSDCSYTGTTRSCGTGSPSGTTIIIPGAPTAGDYPPSTSGSGGTTTNPTTNPNMSADELDLLNNAKQKLLTGHCPNKTIINKVWNAITFKMDPNLKSNAHYDPLTNTVSFLNNSSLNNTTVLEEVFHAYQNSFYPGGISQYEKIGKVNIEFEACVFRDVWAYLADEPRKLARYLPYELISKYNNWIMQIAAYGFTPTNLADYSYWLGKFGQYIPEYNSPTNSNLSMPKAVMNGFQCYNNIN